MQFYRGIRQNPVSDIGRLLKALEEQKINFHGFSLKEDKVTKVLIRNFLDIHLEQVIGEELDNLGEMLLATSHLRPVGESFRLPHSKKTNLSPRCVNYASNHREISYECLEFTFTKAKMNAPPPHRNTAAGLPSTRECLAPPSPVLPPATAYLRNVMRPPLGSPGAFLPSSLPSPCLSRRHGSCLFPAPDCPPFDAKRPHSFHFNSQCIRKLGF